MGSRASAAQGFVAFSLPQSGLGVCVRAQCAVELFALVAFICREALAMGSRSELLGVLSGERAQRFADELALFFARHVGSLLGRTGALVEASGWRCVNRLRIEAWGIGVRHFAVALAAVGGARWLRGRRQRGQQGESVGGDLRRFHRVSVARSWG